MKKTNFENEKLTDDKWRVDKEERLMTEHPDFVLITLRLTDYFSLENNEKAQEVFEKGWKNFCQDALGSEKYEERLTGFLLMPDSLEEVKRDAVAFEDSELGQFFEVDVQQKGRGKMTRGMLGLTDRKFIRADS